MGELNSVHAPNLGYEGDRAAMLRVASGGLVGLDLYFRDGIQWDGVEWPSKYLWLRHLMGPGYWIGIRMFSQGGWTQQHFPSDPAWCDVRAEAWADECWRRLDRLGCLGDPFVVVSPNNEPDLAVEGYGGAATADRQPSRAAYEYIWNWQHDWLKAMRAKILASGAKIALGTGPLAGGHEPEGYPPDYEYQLPQAKAAIALADVLWLHHYIPRESLPDDPTLGVEPGNEGYWHALRSLRPPGYQQDVQGLPAINGLSDPGGAMAQHPGKPVIVAEFGNWHHNDPLLVGQTIEQFTSVYRRLGATGRCLLIAPFVYGAGSEHMDNVINGNAELVRYLGIMERFPGAVWPPAEEEHPVFVFTLGFKDYADRHPDQAGTPTSDLHYFPPDDPFWGIQHTTKGLLVWNKDGNQIQFFRAEPA